MSAFIVTTANLRKETPARLRRRYTRRLIRLTRRIARRRTRRRRVLARQEVGRGTRSTRVRVWRMPRSKQRWRVVGKGVHNGVAWRDIEHDGTTIRVMSAHGLHLRSVGAARQASYYADLATWIADFGPRIDGWVLAGDFNRRHKVIARYLGGRSVGHKIDGVVVSRGLRVDLIRVDWTGVTRGWTDHPAVIAQVTVRPERAP